VSKAHAGSSKKKEKEDKIFQDDLQKKLKTYLH
jgi:hypothetical protein